MPTRIRIPARSDLRSILVILLLGLLGAGFMWWNSRPAAVIPRSTTQSVAPSQATPPDSQPTELGLPVTQPLSGGSPSLAAVGLVTVYVHGAVRHPGVYELPVGSRVTDALGEAGGMLARARPGDLNLARQVSDGEAVFVSGRGQPSMTVVEDPVTSGTPQSGAPISLLTATLEQLETLPGVGPVLAERIIRHRETQGFASVEELQDVPGIGPKTFAELAPRLSP